MVLVKRQQSCPQTCFGSSMLPMGNDDVASSDYKSSHSGYADVRKKYLSSSGTSSLSRWILPLTYGLVVISCFSALRSNNNLSNISTALDSELESLALQRGETLEILKDAKQSKDGILRRHKKLKQTQRLFQHELRMKEELYEMRNTADHKETTEMLLKRHSGTAMTWIQQRQEALYHKIYNLQDFIREQSRKQVIEKYGPGPHRVEFNVASNSGKKPGKFVVELAPVDLVPHSVETFLDMVSNELWDNTVFYHHSSQQHVVAAAPVKYGTYETKHYHFDALGYTGVSYPEYSSEFPHDEYTVGFSGTGPNFYINAMDNAKHHGPGGQGHHELSSDADPCFGKIISGKEIIKEMMPATSRVKDPVSWQDFDLTHIVNIRLLD
jgi:cyclophilin family peptidyl-prolyl cis-trans isomerase